MYDMYPWDSRADSPRARPPAPRDGNDGGDPAARTNDGGDSAARTAATGEAGQPADPATRAVQVALDRRDNGGDTAAPHAADTAHTAIRSGQ